MDENISNHGENNQQNTGDNNFAAENQTTPQQNTNVNNFSMDDRGRIHTGKGGTAAIAMNSSTMLVLGWISAALSLFISPYFAIAGIVFGVVANRQQRGSGNAVIITNVALAVLNLVVGFMFGIFLFSALRRMMMGY